MPIDFLQKKLRLSINPDLIDKNEAGNTSLFSKGWINVELTPDELASKVAQGIAYCCQLAGNRKTENFLCSEILSADFDGSRTLEDALAEVKVWVSPRRFAFDTAIDVVKREIQQEHLYKSVLDRYDDDMKPVYHTDDPLIDMAALARSQQLMSKNNLKRNFIALMRFYGIIGSTLASGLALLSLSSSLVQAQNRNVSGCLSIADVNERVNCLEGHTPTPLPIAPGSPLDQRQPRVVPSFDCRSAATSIERAICSDDELAGLDFRMGQAYQRALRVAKDSSALRDNQRLWLNQRDKVCDNTSVILFSCVSEMTKRRASELSSWSSSVVETSQQSAPVTSASTEAKNPSVAITRQDDAPKVSASVSDLPSKSEPARSQSQGGGLVAILLTISAAWLGFKVLRNINRKRALARRREELIEKYGQEAAERILAGKVWQGMSEPQLLDSWGSPVEVGREVIRDKVKETWKYGQTGKNRFLNRVYLEDGIVIGWKN